MRKIYPVTIDCPVVKRFLLALYDDPLGVPPGGPPSEVIEAFAREHRLVCDGCQAFGNAHNDLN